MDNKEFRGLVDVAATCIERDDEPNAEEKAAFKKVCVELIVKLHAVLARLDQKDLLR